MGVERRDAILSYLWRHQSARVGALAEMFDVSTVTVRADLSSLETAGMVVRLHGAVRLSKSAESELAFAERRRANGAAKARIGAAAAALVQEGDSIALDAGTTTLEIARRLKEREALIVVTNGLDIAMELSHAPGVEIVMLGGRIRKSALSFSGREAEDSLSLYRMDRLFLGVDAFDIGVGLTTDHESEARLNRAMIAAAGEVVAVADSSKFGRRALNLVAPVERLDHLITDTGIPAETGAALDARGVVWSAV
ncbi:transcriptional repressor AgaR [Salinisphaera sp.]|uniref:transcriptional repressor AgaR n=1 Tax=Salinisphaera sp. TaxID=1914330 RepID=UPI002D79764D|nr:transcriptional repressor AgaR [Salinisphaera sp.]HET7314204.1 transcriptional repressor AgaR [Salinisphaera sp.]